MVLIYSWLLACLLTAVVSYHGRDLPQGPFCGTPGLRGGCCKERNDKCRHEILGTFCYCDEFCNATIRQLDDCCPDFEEVCLGVEPPPSELHKGVCLLGATKKSRCNTCTCELIDNAPEWKCEHDTCLISDDVIYGANHGGSWRATNYTGYYDKKLKDGLVYRLGTLPLEAATRQMGAILYGKNTVYPPDFDSRKRWPHYISPVVDQGWCGSDWAVAIASIASDRFAIQSNGAESLVLSPQSLLSCNWKGQSGCEGGHVDVAWNFVKNYGLVDEACFPYEAKVTPCPYIKADLLKAGCKPAISTRKSMYYRLSVPHKLEGEKDIMWEIMESGPVLAVMTVYQDFFHYKDGVYRHTRHGDQIEKGLHSVRVVGWGEDRGDKYWIVANSWGTEWGENGYFRIARGSNESGIESFVIAGMSDVKEANQSRK